MQDSQWRLIKFLRCERTLILEPYSHQGGVMAAFEVIPQFIVSCLSIIYNVLCLVWNSLFIMSWSETKKLPVLCFSILLFKADAKIQFIIPQALCDNKEGQMFEWVTLRCNRLSLDQLDTVKWPPRSINKLPVSWSANMFEIFCFDCDESQDATHIREFDVIRNGVSKGKQATASADRHCIIIYRCLTKAWMEKMSFVWYYLTVSGVLLRYAQRQDYFTVADPETELRKNCLYVRQIRLGYDNGPNKGDLDKHQKQGIIQSVAWELNQTCLTGW